MQTILKSAFLIFIITISCSVLGQQLLYTQEQCPVIGNTKTGIYHVPGGNFYQRMLVLNKDRKENRRCFKNQNEAIKAGFRKSKR